MNIVAAAAGTGQPGPEVLQEAKAYLSKHKPVPYRPREATFDNAGQCQYVERVLAEVYRIAGDAADEEIIRWAARADDTDMDEIVRWWKFQGANREFLDEEGRVDLAPVCEGTAPPRQWIVHDWLAPGHVTMLSGPGGAGKTSIALDLAVDVSNGWSWYAEPVARKGPVLAWFCEDDQEELQRRLSASVCSQRNHHAVDKFEAAPGDRPDESEAIWESLKGIRIYSRVGLDNHLVRENARTGRLETTAFYDQLERTIERQRPALVIVDNAGQVFGGNENDRGQVTLFMNLLNGISYRHRCAILLLSHPAKMAGSQYSGSTAWENVARSRWLLSVSDDKKVRTLAVEKSNYGGYPSMQLTYDPDRRGFVRIIGPSPEAIKAMEPRVLAVLDQLHAKDLAPKADKARGRMGIWQLASDEGLVDDVDEKTFKAAVLSLAKADKIRDDQPLPGLSRAPNRQVRRGLARYVPKRQEPGAADRFQVIEGGEIE